MIKSENRNTSGQRFVWVSMGLPYQFVLGLAPQEHRASPWTLRGMVPPAVVAACRAVSASWLPEHAGSSSYSAPRGSASETTQAQYQHCTA